MDDEVRLRDHDQQSHVGPPKLWERKSTAQHSFKGVLISMFGRMLKRWDDIFGELVPLAHF